MAAGRLNVDRMITHRIPITEAERAYDIITGKIKEPYFGIILQYPERNLDGDSMIRTVQVKEPAARSAGALGIGFIGAGNFAQSFLIPPAKSAGARLVSVATSTSVNARSVAEKFGFEQAATDVNALLGLDGLDAVFIATRHDTHGTYVAKSLEAGKQVFVEKPLAITREELATIREVVDAKGGRVMVGFNRRFSAPLVAMKKHFAGNDEPMVMMYRVNAGHIKMESWIQAASQGGRIIGEGCHFIDSMQYMCGARPVSIYAASIGSDNAQVRNADSVSITIRFSDGSVGTLLYLANGDPSVAKEYFEVFSGGRTAIMHNFKSLTLARGRKQTVSKFNGDKGHADEVKQTIEAMKSGTPMPISFESLCDTTIATFAAMESLATGDVVRI
jgi:polar amino acid transport system substrate-binding protein